MPIVTSPLRFLLIAAIGCLLVTAGIAFSSYLLLDGTLMALRPMTVRTATADDPIRGRYTGFYTDFDLKPRGIAVLEGPFKPDTRIEVTLYLVRDRRVEKINDVRLYRSPHERGGPTWMRRQVVFALGEAEQQEGRLTLVGGRGTGAGSYSGGEVTHDIDIKFRQTFPGRLEVGETYLLHVEGNRRFGARRKMTVEEFAQVSDGSFLVVTISRRGA